MEEKRPTHVTPDEGQLSNLSNLSDTTDVSVLLRRLGGPLSRRAVLQRALALGLSAPVIAALLAACGGDDDDGGDATATTGTGGDATPTTGTGGDATATTGTGGDATATTGTGGAGEGGTLVIGANLDDVLTFDPALHYEITSQQMLYAAYESLVFQAPDDLNAYIPVLAEEVPSQENGGISEDGLTYTVKLKQGVMFHNSGNEMTADDWVFSMKRLAYGKKNPSFLTDPFTEKDADGNVTAVNCEKVDDYTITFTLGSPNVAFIAILATTNVTVTDSKVVAENGGLDTPEAEADDTAAEFLNQTSAGTGPYRVTSYKNKEEVVLESHPDYHGGAPAFDQIVFRYVADSGTQLQQLQAGEIDIAQNLDADAIETVKSDGNLSVVEGNSLNHTYLALHTQEDPGGILADVRVRQAIAQAIDYDGIISGLRGGAAVRPATAVPLGLLSAEEAEDLKYVQDVEAATALITEAGVEGETIQLTFGSGGNYDGVPTETLASKLQADIEPIGIKVELVPMDSQQRLADFREGKLQFTFSSWSPDFVDVHTYAEPFGGVPDIAPSRRVGWVNEANVELLAQGIQEFDTAARTETYLEVQQNYLDECPFIVLWQPVFQVGMKAEIKGYRIHPVTLTMLSEITREA